MRKNSPRKRLISICLIVTVLIPNLIFSTGFTASDSNTKNINLNVKPGISRVYGNDRFQTSLKVAAAVGKESGIKVDKKFQSIIVTRGDRFADALSGSSLSKDVKAPIILLPKGSASNQIKYIKDNIAKDGTVYILGGTMAVPASIESSLKSFTTVERLSGDTKLDTNLAILSKLNPEGKNVLVCSADNYPDALSASATGDLILLVSKSLNAKQKKWLNGVKDTIKGIFVIGGDKVIPESVKTALEAYGKPVERVAGNNRYGTSVEVAKKFFGSATEAVVARGDDYADSLSAGPLAIAKEAPLLLSAKTLDFHPAYKYLFKKARIKAATIIGGPKFIANDSTGLTTAGGKKKGLLDICGIKYFSNDAGNLIKNQTKTVGGKKYFFTDGYYAAITGWHKYQDLYYYFRDYKITETSLAGKKILDTVGHDLKKAFNWSYNRRYVKLSGIGPQTGSEWCAGYGFAKKQGFCYVKAGTFFYMAKMLGYDAVQVYGTIGSKRQPHSWVEITENGKTYVYDLSYGENNYRFSGWRFNYGASGSWYYNKTGYMKF